MLNIGNTKVIKIKLLYAGNVSTSLQVFNIMHKAM